MIKDTRYDKVLQEFKGDFDVLMRNYLQKLHDAFHEDKGIKYSHTDIVDKIKQDCMSIFSYKLGRITFDDRSEDEIIKHCLKRNDPGWFQFGIHELLQNGKIIPGRIGSMRTQFCKFCGTQIYLTNKSTMTESSSDIIDHLEEF